LIKVELLNLHDGLIKYDSVNFKQIQLKLGTIFNNLPKIVIKKTFEVLCTINVMLSNQADMIDKNFDPDHWYPKVEALLLNPKLFTLGNIIGNPLDYEKNFVVFVQSMVEAVLFAAVSDQELPSSLMAFKKEHLLEIK
jgi:hypothetical protein